MCLLLCRLLSSQVSEGGSADAVAKTLWGTDPNWREGSKWEQGKCGLVPQRGNLDEHVRWPTAVLTLGLGWLITTVAQMT